MQLPESRIKLNNLVKESLLGKTGSEDILINDKITTIAFQPVVVKGKSFLTLDVNAQNSLASDVGTLIDQLKYFTTLVVIIIGIVALVIAFLVFSWNKQLEKTVVARTAQLKNANDSLASAVEQLKVHDKMQKEFINIASHEMKTPTQAILGYSTLIHRHPEKQTEMLQGISRNATRLQKMTNEILGVTRIESQSLRLRKEYFNLLEVISSVVNDYKSQLEKANTNVELVFERNRISDDKPIFVQADKSRITQVISNLLDNAIKFAKEIATTTTSGNVAVSVLSEPEKFGDDNDNDNKKEVVISVKDTGTGIDPEIFPKLFSKFATKSESGTGLGLFISKSIIEAHGGKIWAENINSNGKKGAIFCFSLPLSNNINNRYKI